MTIANAIIPFLRRYIFVLLVGMDLLVQGSSDPQQDAIVRLVREIVRTIVHNIREGA